MSSVGRRLWLHMQATTPPFNRRTLASALKQSGVYPTSPQSISNYLYRDHPPVGFVNAMVDMLHLSEEHEQELHWLYFRGTGESGSEPPMKDIPETPGLTEENRTKIEAKKREWDEKDRERSEESNAEPKGNSRDAGDRV